MLCISLALNTGNGELAFYYREEKSDPVFTELLFGSGMERAHFTLVKLHASFHNYIAQGETVGTAGSNKLLFIKLNINR